MRIGSFKNDSLNLLRHDVAFDISAWHFTRVSVMRFYVFIVLSVRMFTVIECERLLKPDFILHHISSQSSMNS